MQTENLTTLKIHKLTQEQYDRELASGRIDPNAIYLTPDEEIDLSPYATVDQLNTKAEVDHTHNISDVSDLQSSLDGKVPTSRTVNGKSLAGDIVLSASDIGADAGGAASSVQSNLDTHTGNKSNPHEVTAEQVGALPLTGGVIEQPTDFTQEGMQKIPLTIKAYNSSGTYLKFSFPESYGGMPKYNIAFNDSGLLGFASDKGGLYWTGQQAAWGSVLRNSKLVSADTDPTVNGEICWTYK